MNPINESTISLDVLSSDMKRNVTRLLGREVYELSAKKGAKQRRVWIYIDPFSPWVLTWNIIFVVVFYFIELQISWELAFGPYFFENQLDIGFYKPAYFTFLTVMILDIVMNLFKGYYAFGKGKVIDDPGKIMRHYLTSQFPIDFFVVIFYIIPLIYQNLGLNFLQLIPAAFIWIKKFQYQD